MLQSFPKVYIIIPTNKGAKNIARAVNSAFSQDYDNIEVIVVDDNGKGTDAQVKTEIAMYSINLYLGIFLRKSVENGQIFL